jgi:hypothetical protein
MTKTLHETEMSAVVGSLVTITYSVKMLYLQKNYFSVSFRENITCPHIDLLRLSKIFLFPVKLYIEGL